MLQESRIRGHAAVSSFAEVFCLTTAQGNGAQSKETGKDLLTAAQTTPPPLFASRV